MTQAGSGLEEGPGLRVGIVGCGLIGGKRAQALRGVDELVGATDWLPDRAVRLTDEHGGAPCRDLAALLDLRPDAVIVATTHDQLERLAEASLRAGAHVLVEKPGGISSAEIDRLQSAERTSGRRVKVGFNHRFHPALADLSAEVHSGVHGELMHLRARYGHGGRVGYEREWRAQPERAGGGELVDQGMHLLDLTHWLAGPLPLHCALLRTQFWEISVEDNAALILGDGAVRKGPWAMLHVTWTEWKNTFSVEVYCRTAKLEVEGLVRSYGPQRLRIYRMHPDMTPPDLEERAYGEQDISWATEWRHFTTAIALEQPFLGNLDDARYAWERVEDAYTSSGEHGAPRTVDGR